jgi:energy-coupling factor transporter ATP-binding protein EcfA2
MGTGNIHADIGGEVSGQLVIGNGNVQNSIHGVNINYIAQPTLSYRRRSLPSGMEPMPHPLFLDRRAEVDAIVSATRAGTPVMIYGRDGMGKTTLLRYLTGVLDRGNFPDGMIYLRATQRNLIDLLQYLFDAFFDCDQGFMPTPGQIRAEFQKLRALILLDDLDLDRKSITELLDTAPHCTFVVAASERALWGAGRTIPLHGLPLEDILTLLQRDLGLSLTEPEQAEVESISSICAGNPFEVLRVIEAGRERGESFGAIRKQLQAESGASSVMKVIVQSLSESQRRIMTILAAAGNVLVPREHLAKISQAADIDAEMNFLAAHRLVQSHSPRYSLAGALRVSLEQIWDIAAWDTAIGNYLLEWLSQKPSDAMIEEAADMLVEAVKRAGEKQRWKEVERLGLGMERALILYKRWGDWLQVLRLVLQAARVLKDRAIEAWALHQMGSRALCLGLQADARSLLSQALQIRHALGDRAGAALTQHNLSVFGSLPAGPTGKSTGCRRCLTCSGIGVAGAVVSLIVLVFALIRIAFPPRNALPIRPTDEFRSSPTSEPFFIPSEAQADTPLPVEPPTSEPTLTFTLTPSLTPTWTPSPTPTWTPSITPTWTFVPTWTLTPNATPLAPEIVSPGYSTSVDCTSDFVPLVWNASFDLGGIEQYQVSLEVLSDGVNWTPLDSWYVGSSSTSFDVTTLIKNNCDKSLKWQVRAQDKDFAWGDWSLWAYFFTNSPPSMPEIAGPKNDEIIICTDINTSLDWQESYDLSGIYLYQVFIETSKNKINWSPVLNKEVTYPTELNITTQIKNNCETWFRWSVRAQDINFAWGKWSSPARFFSNQRPKAPKTVQTKDPVYCPHEKVILEWEAPDDPSGISGYRVYVDVSSDGVNWGNRIIRDTTLKELDITNHVNNNCGRFFRWLVFAKDTFGTWGELSPWRMFKSSYFG